MTNKHLLSTNDVIRTIRFWRIGTSFDFKVKLNIRPHECDLCRYFGLFDDIEPFPAPGRYRIITCTAQHH